MKIESSSVNLFSHTQNIQQYKNEMRVQTVVQESNQNSIIYGDSVKVKANYSDKMIVDNEDNLSIKDKINKLIIEELLKKLFKDKKENSLYPKDKFNGEISFDKSATQSQRTQNSSGFGAIITVNESYYEKQSIDFRASAIIKTDKMDIAFDLNLSFSQEFYLEHNLSIAIGDANLLDPLVINYGGDLNGFDNISKNLHFMFDLNSDGNLDKIPLLKNGSGFLALDKNNNGIIDDGSELFGPQSGRGFEELKAYDSDNNNWIDENDYIFNNLKIWQIDEAGNNQIISLAEAGIGAIYLANITSEFSYKQSVDKQTAQLANNSIFLKENGSAGIISEVKFVV
ncbi:MAG: hypothetical protein RBQ81_07945 [Arcobacteraceae bacterium]|jgi:hypothetical protein|nr:hypothetical protein [Arcobacteraceae bacterium]MDY0365776.1 hypothetical protein [Arcobacteraceae bacterium]